jgi:fatty acid CoA ligase FadD9
MLQQTGDTRSIELIDRKKAPRAPPIRTVLRSRHSPAPSTGPHGQNLFKLAQGLFVVPEKIEAALTIGCPSIRECFVYGDGSRSHLVAVVVPRSSTVVDDDADHQRLKLVIAEEIRAVSKKEEMRYYEVPREVILARESFSEHNGQRTITGKLNRRALAEHYRADIDAAYARATTQARLTRDTIRDAIAHTINPGAEQLEESQQASLLELGGDSLGAVNLMKIIRERFAVSLPLAMVLERPIGELAEYVERHSGGGGAASGEGEDLPSQGGDSSTAATQSIDWRRDSRLDPEIISLLDEKCQVSSQVRCPFLT